MTGAGCMTAVRRLPRWLSWLIRCTLGGIFIYAGWSKMGNPWAFADSIASFHLLPNRLISPLALGLPVFEVLAGIAIFIPIGRFQRVGALAILLLCGIFAMALAQALARGLSVDCGCFGSGAPSIGKTGLALARDLLIGAAAFWMYRQSDKVNRR